MVVDRGLRRRVPGATLERGARLVADRVGGLQRRGRLGVARAPLGRRARARLRAGRAVGGLSRPAQRAGSPGRRAGPGQRAARLPRARRRGGRGLAPAAGAVELPGPEPVEAPSAEPEGPVMLPTGGGPTVPACAGTSASGT